MPAQSCALVLLRIDERRWSELPFDVQDLCECAVEASFASVGQRTYGEVSVLLTNDPAMGMLNSRYRRREGPTNVLSFPARKQPAHGAEEHGPVMWGDIAMSFDRVDHEAKCGIKSIRSHMAHLLVHGTLHLLGFDHKESPEAAAMERLEVSSLARLGIGDPFSDNAGVEFTRL